MGRDRRDIGDSRERGEERGRVPNWIQKKAERESLTELVEVVFGRRVLEESGLLSSKFDSASPSSCCGTNREAMVNDSPMRQCESVSS